MLRDYRYAIEDYNLRRTYGMTRSEIHAFIEGLHGAEAEQFPGEPRISEHFLINGVPFDLLRWELKELRRMFED